MLRARRSALCTRKGPRGLKKAPSWGTDSCVTFQSRCSPRRDQRNALHVPIGRERVCRYQREDAEHAKHEAISWYAFGNP